MSALGRLRVVFGGVPLAVPVGSLSRSRCTWQIGVSVQKSPRTLLQSEVSR